MTIDRRSLLTLAGLAPLMNLAPRLAWAADPALDEKADYTLRIATGLVELAPDHIVSTTLYNDQFPGPLLRFTEGKRVVIDVHNDTDTPELVHWHGQTIPTDVDGAAEEGTPFIPPHGTRRIAFVPETRRLPLRAFPRPGRRRPHARAHTRARRRQSISSPKQSRRL